MQGHAGFQFHGTLPDVVASHPSFQHVVPGGEVLQPISARCVCFLKMGRLQDENGAAHSFVNFTMNGDRPRLVEDDRGRFFVFAITAQIEPFCLRIGKNVVVGVVHIRELDRAADQDRQEIRRERDVLLRHLGRRFGTVGLLGTKIALQVDYRRRRVGWSHWNVVAGPVALIEAAVERRLRQLDGAFDNCLSANGSGRESESENDDRISVAHRYSVYSENGASVASNQVPLPWLVRFVASISGWA